MQSGIPGQCGVGRQENQANREERGEQAHGEEGAKWAHPEMARRHGKSTAPGAHLGPGLNATITGPGGPGKPPYGFSSVPVTESQIMNFSW